MKNDIISLDEVFQPKVLKSENGLINYEDGTYSIDFDKPLSEYSREELAAYRIKIAAKISEDNISKGAWNSYFDKALCRKGEIVRDYGNGRKELYSYDENTGKATFIKNL
jgi:hypothetical protein